MDISHPKLIKKMNCARTSIKFRCTSNSVAGGHPRSLKLRSTKTLTIPYVLKTYKINQKTTRCVCGCHYSRMNENDATNKICVWFKAHNTTPYIYINWRKFEMCTVGGISVKSWALIKQNNIWPRAYIILTNILDWNAHN